MMLNTTQRVLLCSMFSIMLGSCATTLSKHPAAHESTLAKNVILFIGDGMGVSTVTAVRIFDGQSKGLLGEDHILPFERFPDVALIKTYNVNQQVPDSAGTASAITTGVKTNAGFIGVGPQAERGNCQQSQKARLTTLGEVAQNRGKAVGVVSSARLTHATPASMYAHSPERDWEADADMPTQERRAGCQDIAAQLLDFPFSIALGGGVQNFRSQANGGRRLAPETDLAKEWSLGESRQFVQSREEMMRLDHSSQVLGLFSDSHMSFVAEKRPDSTEPSLTEMTAAALAHLKDAPLGYVLMVEGGRIDHGHHIGKAGYALTEGQEFAKAVEYAAKNTDTSETLILVTADHSHVFSIAGYPTRGNDILGLVVGNNDKGYAEQQPELATDGLPYTTLGYWNGPGAVQGKRRYPDTGFDAIQQAVIPTGSGFDKTEQRSETHGGEDVAIYAVGPGSDGVHGVMEQNEIFHVITDALGW